MARAKTPQTSAAQPSHDWVCEIAELKTALTNHSISAVHLANAHYGGIPEFNPDDSSRCQLEGLYQKALEAYEVVNGPVLRSFFSNKVWAWVLLSEKEGLKIGCRPKAPDIIQFTNRALDLSHSANDYLPWNWRGAANVLYAAVNQAIGNLEERLARGSIVPTRADAQFMAVLDKELSRAEALIRRGARLVYLAGVLGGFLIASLGGLLIPAIAGLLGYDAFAGPLVSTSLIFGSLGAGMSVLQRFRTSSLEVDISSGKSLLALAGLFRPPVGAIAGLVAYMAHASGLLFSSLTFSSPDKATLFYGVVAFFSGFTERVFQARIGALDQ